MGDGSKKDMFTKSDRQKLFERFLDYVERQNGRLYIIGDFLELWKFSFEKIVEKRKDLLSRIKELDGQIILGNHDAGLQKYLDSGDIYHDFLRNVRPCFYKSINGRLFKFMHGHEADPFIGDGLNCLGPAIGRLAKLLEVSGQACLVTNDTLSDILLEIGEQILYIWHKLTRMMNRAVEHWSDMIPNENAAMLKRPIRTIKMLTRYLEDKKRSLYDVAVTGHTHKQGYYQDWYYNSGSWTGNRNNFLRIQPDGNIEVFDWMHWGKELSESKIKV